MRKLASIQQIAEIKEIQGADAIVAVRVNDWWCVAKKNEFSVGDLCVYHEVDCLLPVGGCYDFLASRGTKKSELEDGTIVEGYRLRTIRLRGQLSQGLALPINILPEELNDVSCIGHSITAILGIHKYERPMAAQLRGQARGNFPSFARKSDQERCQNLRHEIWQSYMNGDEFQITVKLDGSSMTIFGLDEPTSEKLSTEPRFGVCSRNLELKETEGNAFWDVARRENIEQVALRIPGLVIQGELISPSIQGNFEGVSRPDFYVYNLFDAITQEWVPPKLALEWSLEKGLLHVPVLETSVTLSELFPEATENSIIQSLLNYAEGPSAFGGKYREGVVFKRLDGKFSFKAISNSYLLKEKD